MTATGKLPRTMREVAESFGIPADQVERAEADGTLPLLVIDHVVLPEPGIYAEEDVARITGLGDEARRLWRALGMPNPDPNAKTFSDVDIEMLRIANQFLSLGLVEHDVVFQMARVIGSSIWRIAETQIDAIESQAESTEPAEPIHPSAEGTEITLLRAGMMLNTMPRILEYTWRRHLQMAARRRLLAVESSEEVGVVVGFADLVGFTALSQQLTEQELGAVVDRFEHISYDIVGECGGRVVKMIGDEVMFSVEDPAAGVEIALRLSDAYHNDEDISDVRVGLAMGPVMQREGDLYGTTVNLASRIVSIAYPSSVVVSSEIHETLADDEALIWKSLRTRFLKGIGRVQLWHVRRAGDVPERAVDRARRRRDNIRNRVAELVERRPGKGDDGDGGGEEEE